MQYRQIPVACIQTLAHDRAAFETTWPRILARVDEAGERGAALIVLPEATVPGYVLGTEAVSPETIERAIADLAKRAKTFGATIVCGIAKVVEGTTYNAAVVIGPDGRELGFAAKQFLWHFDRRWFSPGETLDPIDTPLGKLGLLVCADGRIPTIAATLCERGAEILVMPTAWVTSGRDPEHLENIQADLMANVRARENGVPFVVANKAGFERASVAYCGKSAIVDATGTFVARGSEANEEIVFGSISPRPRAARALRPAIASLDAIASGEKQRLRIAFTPSRYADEILELGACAADADADLLLSYARLSACETDRAYDLDGLRCAIVAPETIADPRGLVAARLAGIDCFIWLAERGADRTWELPLARTRAAELRAFVIIFVPAEESANERAYVVDPDGLVVAGTFGGLRLAAFVYDPARTAATTVAPTTDVLAGLRTAEAIRARHIETIVHAR